MNDEILEFLTHDQIIASVQRFYDILWENHDLFMQEEAHKEKDVILDLLDTYTDIFNPIICYTR